MKKLNTKKTLTLQTETIKALNDEQLSKAAGGRWYESWSLCGGGGALPDMPNAVCGVRG